jgi:hypothetical protein
MKKKRVSAQRDPVQDCGVLYRAASFLPLVAWNPVPNRFNGDNRGHRILYPSMKTTIVFNPFFYQSSRVN